MKFIFSILLIVCLGYSTLHASFTNRFKTNQEGGSLLDADEITYDKQQGLITARGRVKIEREGRTLYADIVTYNEKKDLVTASGHVMLNEMTGDIIYVDYAELTGDLKNGFVKKIRMLLADDARLVAHRAHREGGILSHFEQGVYSPCHVCKVDPHASPFWQLKAKNLVIDEEAQDYIYTDAYIEMFGIPTFYTPYLRHPAPQVKRRSGILSMMISRTPELGWFGITQYFWNISPDKDMTFTPLLRSNGKGVLGLQYRQRFERGQFTFEGSIDPGSSVVDSKGNKLKESNRLRWHIAPEAKYDFTKNIRGGLRIERASDQTYLRRYAHLGLSTRTFLTSHLYGEGFWGRNYGILQGYSFQGLRLGDKEKTTPLLFPWGIFSYLSKPDSEGGRWSVDADGLMLTRGQGTKYERLSTTGGWQKLYTSSWGDVYTIGAKVRGDIYQVHNYKPLNSQTPSAYNTTVARAFPQLYGIWNYPFLQHWHSYRLIAEPVLGLVAAPVVEQPTKLPNEDSRFIEFNDANLMSESRFAGLDRIDGGSRMNYGFNFSGFSQQNGNAGFFIGQSLAFQSPKDYLVNTGLDKRLSDIVARVKYNYQDWFQVKTRFLIDRTTFHSRRQETSLGIGKPIFRFSAEYIHVPLLPNDPAENANKQLQLTFSSMFHENWSGSITTTRDVGKRAGTLSQGLSLTYANECFIMANTLTKTFFVDRDLRPGLTYMFRISFKNLGEFSQSFGGMDEKPGSAVSAY